MPILASLLANTSIKHFAGFVQPHWHITPHQPLNSQLLLIFSHWDFLFITLLSFEQRWRDGLGQFLTMPEFDVGARAEAMAEMDTFYSISFFVVSAIFML